MLSLSDRVVERGSTFTLTSDLSYTASISFANVNFTHVRTLKITRLHWKSTLRHVSSVFLVLLVAKGPEPSRPLNEDGQGSSIENWFMMECGVEFKGL